MSLNNQEVKKNLLLKINKAILNYKKNSTNILPLLIDCINLNFVEGVKVILLSNKFDSTLKDKYVIVLASKLGRIEIVKILLSNPVVNPAINNNMPLIQACLFGRRMVVNYLLSHPKVDPSVNNQLALNNACYNEHPHVVEALLNDPRVDPTINNQYLLYESALLNKFEITKILLLDNRMGFPNFNKPFLIEQLENNSTELLTLLFRNISKPLPVSLLTDSFCLNIGNKNINNIRLFLSLKDDFPISEMARYIVLAAAHANANEILSLILNDERVHFCNFSDLFIQIFKSNQNQINLINSTMWVQPWLQLQVLKNNKPIYDLFHKQYIESKLDYF